MKVSEINLDYIKNYLRIDMDDDDNDIENIIMPAILAYIKSETGLDDSGVNTKDDLTIAYMILAKEMYDNRNFTVQNDKVNPLVSNILGRYAVNLL